MSKMSRLSVFVSIIAVLVVSNVAAIPETAAATAQRDKCYIHPDNLRRQCFQELGATCDPREGRYWLRGPSGGTIKGTARVEACIAEKRARRAKGPDKPSPQKAVEKPPQQKTTETRKPAASKTIGTLAIRSECLSMRDQIGCTCALNNGGGIDRNQKRWYSVRGRHVRDGGTPNQAFTNCVAQHRGS